MGNATSPQKLTKSYSIKYNEWRYNKEHQHINPLKNRDTPNEEYLEHLQKRLEEFEVNLDAYDKEANERSQEIETLLKVLAGHKSKGFTEDAKDDKTAHNKIDETIERIENFMRNLQLGRSERSLKDSLKGIRSEIDKCVDVFKENVKNSKDMNDKSEHGQLQAKKKRRKEKEGKLSRGFQHQNKAHIEEQECEPESRVSAKVQILFTQHGNTMHEIVQELQTVLTQRIGPVDFIHLKEKSEVNDEMLMIIVYIVTTRVGADASYAMENIKNPKNVALLLVHIGEAHAVSNKNSSLHLTKKEFIDLQGIFDMSFKTGTGFYQCDMNEKSINGLSCFSIQNPFSIQKPCSESHEKEDKIETLI